MLWALVGVAFALPPALLGPEGPMWVGPLPPAHGAPLVVVVDPQSGALEVEATERDGRIRRWTADGWKIDGALIDPETPNEGHRMDGDKLVKAEALFGASQQFQYDEEGRLNGLVWANGGRLTVRYDDAGRVRELIGPGTQRLGLRWSDGLRISDSRGRATQVSVLQTDLNRAVTVTDPLGRSVVSRYRQREEGWRLTGWTDQRGLETRIGEYAGRMDVTAPGGRVFRMEVDPNGVVASVTEPGGQQWRWERDDEGRVSRMFDPAGRVTRIEYSGAGHPVVVAPSGRINRLHRDGQGRITGIQEPTGANTQLVRGEDGRVRSIIDSLGNAMFIERFPNGWPSAVLERSGARWELGLDALGKPDRVEGPMGRVIQLHRNGGGQLERIEDNVHGTVTLVRDSDGAVRRITDARGRVTEFERDGTGRVHSITRADGSVVQMVRDPMGEVTSVRLGEEVLSIVRRPDGRPSRVGEWKFERDINGRVRRMVGPIRAWTLLREPAGWVRAIQVDDWRVDVERDANGWPVVWSGVDGDEEIQRDAAGRLVVDGDGVRVLRDSRGLPVRITAGQVGEWRVQRDASGRMLSTRGPGGTMVSLDRDATGRPKFFRFPDGSMLRCHYEGDTRTDMLVDPNGNMVGQQQLSLDEDGRPATRVDASGHVWRYQRDAIGRLLALDTADGRAWIWGEDTVNDPEGRVQLQDGTGWMIEAQLAGGLKSWGIATDMISMHREDGGRLVAIGGDEGLTTLKADALGRLVEIDPPSSSPWQLRYDVRGRPVGVTRPDGTQDKWQWAPDADPVQGASGVLVTGENFERPWAFTEHGMAARLVAMEQEGIVADALGTPSWVLDGVGGATSLAYEPAGLPAEAGGGIVGLGGQLQWFPGGPIQMGSWSFDPVSGERVDGVKDWPWVVADPGEWTDMSPHDPSPWASTRLWTEPIRMLEALGVVQSIMPSVWRRLGEDPRAHEALAVGLDGSKPPLGPHREALPLVSEDPVTDAMITALISGGEPPSGLTIAAVLIEQEIELPWLPPGLAIPGLEIWRNAGAWSEK